MKARNIIILTTALTTLDTDNSSSTIEKSYILTSTIDKPEVISPLTTLIKGQVDKNSSLSSLEAANLVATQLNITSDSTKLFEDYVKNESTDTVSKQLHEVSKVVVQLMVDIEEKIKEDLGISSISEDQRLGLNYLINDIVFSNIDTIAAKIKENETIDDLTAEISAIVDNNEKTELDLDSAISATARKTLTQLLAGKVFYSSGEGSTILEKLTVSADMKSSTWKEIVGGVDGGSDTITSVSAYNMELTSNETGEVWTITLIEEYSDYLVMIGGEKGKEQNTNRFYYDQDKAMEYYGLKPKQVPINTISTSNDWNSIEPIYTEASGDAALSGLDIVEVKISQDDSNLYIDLKRAGLQFPESGYYYNYWIYFRSQNKTFSIENFHDNEGLYGFTIYDGIGYQGGVEVLNEYKTANTTDVHLQLIVPKSLNLIEENVPYTVSIFTHGFANGIDDIQGEKQDDSSFSVEF